MITILTPHIAYMHTRYKDDPELLKFFNHVIALLLNGERDIPVHPSVDCIGDTVNARDISDNVDKFYSNRRKVCHELGELLFWAGFSNNTLDCDTQTIKASCSRFISPRRRGDEPLLEKWGMWWDNKCHENVYGSKLWSRCSCNGEYSSWLTFCVPYQSKVGVRFIFDGERQDHKLSKEFKIRAKLVRERYR